MTRFPRLRRRPDQWANAHDRARARAAERLDGPLGLAESTWLEAHLAECPSCAAIAAAYEADRMALRGLRDEQPDPPRDLWARTAAAIELLSNESSVPDQVPAAERRRRVLGGLPLGAMSAFAVVVVVVGATLLTNGIGTPQRATAPDAGGAGPSVAAASVAPEVVPPAAEPTPFAVGAGDVAWVDTGPDGLAYSNVEIDSVCPTEDASGCPALRDSASTRLGLTSATRTIIGSPTSKQAVAIAKGTESGDDVIVVQLPQPTTTTPPSPTPAASVQPSTQPSAAATDGPGETATSTEEPSPTVTVQTSESPLETPIPTTAAKIAIASGIQVVGESAAFSSDGTWFAFTARPVDGSGGPDVFVWRVGAERAERLTNDGHSYFASWSGDRIVVSRPSDASSVTSDPASGLVDPASGDERAVGSVWRPMVDPSGRLAIAWIGTIERTEDSTNWAPGRGQLELRAWSADGDAGSPEGSEGDRVVADSARGDFDVRWDDSGEWVALWVGEERDATTGRLTLYHVDAKRGRLEKVNGAPVDVRSLPGFSIGSGRLAWATPRGQGGEGSRVQIAAWSGSGIGIAESSPGEDVRIIR
jgi:hypothetical protein